MNCMKEKGQGTLEYLILLSVILIIAFVVATQVLKLGSNPQINEEQSRIYWTTQASPLSIPEYSITSSGAQIVLQNNSNQVITVTDLNLGGTLIVSSPASINPGSKQTVSSTSLKCTAGSSFSYKVRITYNTESLTNVPFEGRENLVGNCAA